MNILVNENTPEFQTWINTCRTKLAEYMAKNYPNNPKDELVAESGTRYIKVISQSVEKETVGKRAGLPLRVSVWAFIDKTTGDVLKPASWSAPAKQARGNIFDEKNGMGSMTPYGPAYIRGPMFPW